jgi:hypothetical protein
MKKSLLVLFLIAAASGFPGCATPYQPIGATGGFEETQLAPDVFRISFRGNGFTSSDRTQDFVLLRAADLTLVHGFHYFAIVNEANGGSMSSITLPGSSYTTGTATRYGNTAYGSAITTYVPPTDIPIFKPHSGLLIRCFPGQPKGVYGFDASFLANTIRQKYQLKN